MKDRTSNYPGRVRLTPVEGQPNVYDREWADEPQQLGTPLNKATLLSDAVAAALRLTQADPTVSDALAGGLDLYTVVTEAERPPEQADARKAGDIWVDRTESEHIVYLSLPDESGVLQWYGFRTTRKAPKTVVFTESTVWTVPDDAKGAPAVVYVYGAGGSGARYYGAGGGGGEMATWSGVLDQLEYNITVGKGGAVQSSTTSGKAGGASSFGSIVSANGGSGSSGYNGGSGGSGGGGAINGNDDAASGNGGNGTQFGGGGGSGWKTGSYQGNGGSGVTGNGQSPTASAFSSDGGMGINTRNLDVPDLAKGTGAGGTGGGASNAINGGGGGGYGGKGGSATTTAAGGGGGYGTSGNGATATTPAGYGGGGTYNQKGGDGIIVVIYQGW